LQSAQRLVKPGGRLLYATCSVLNEENDQQVARFLKANEDFVAEAFERPVGLTSQADKLMKSRSQVQILSSVTGTDGFFVASLRRAN